VGFIAYAAQLTVIPSRTQIFSGTCFDENLPLKVSKGTWYSQLPDFGTISYPDSATDVTISTIHKRPGQL